MRKTDLQRFRKLLLDEKERVMQSLAQHEKVIKHNELSGLETGKAHSNHMADQGSDEFLYETTIKFANAEGRYLYSIEEALRRIERSGKKHAADIVVAFCTQEEVGLRGATTAANQVGADIGVGLDVNLACDTPGVPESQRVTKHGDGAAIMVQDSSMISDYTLVQEICAVAKKHRIPHQRAILPRGGQDGAAIQRSGRGARCVALGAGTRYIHTTTEMIDKGDLEAVIELLTTWLPTIE